MNANARKWLAALRSGEFDQSTGKLHTANGYCCLGVACEIYRRETGVGEWEWHHGGYFEFVLADDCERSHLPRLVQSWLQLDSDAGQIDEKGGPLTDRNDFGASFNEIADVIEREPKGLFVP